MDYTFDSEDRRSILLSALPQTAVNAYIACLENSTQSIFVTFNKNAMNNEQFFVKISVKQSLVSAKVPAIVEISEASFLGVDSKQIGPSAAQARVFLATASAVPILIKRDLTQPFSIVVKAGPDTTDPIVLPAQPTTEMRRELRYSAYAVGFSLYQVDTVHDEKDVCVEISNDDPAVIIPKTIEFKTISIKTDKLTFGAEPPKTAVYSPKTACVHGTENIGGNGASICARGYATVEVLVPVKRGDAASAKSQDPTKLYDQKFLHGC